MNEFELLKKKYEIALREYKKLWAEKHKHEPQIPLEFAINREAEQSFCNKERKQDD